MANIRTRAARGGRFSRSFDFPSIDQSVFLIQIRFLSIRKLLVSLRHLRVLLYKKADSVQEVHQEPFPVGRQSYH